jgi:uncharacterized protein YndB with AHSA1/START domain
VNADRIEKKVVLQAPRSRVWRAIANAEEFGTWFGANLSGAAFAPGARVSGPITYPGYEHWTLELTIEALVPESLLSYRWHPYATPGGNYAAEPTTLVEFQLGEVKEGTILTVLESGFDRLPPGRREEAFRMNEGGWAAQLGNVERHVSA